MRSRRGIFKFSLAMCWAVCSSFLVGCEDPAVEVGSLGRKLSAPVLMSQSPFDQSYKTQNYVHLTGSCDTRVGDIYLSFKASSSTAAVDVSHASDWHSPSTSPNTTGTSLSSVNNDFNCADGSFDFYLTEYDIISIWGFDPSSASVDVSEIDLKGSTMIGDTQILALINSHSGNGGGSTPVLATNINIEKGWPQGFAGQGNCEVFNIYLTDSSDHYAVAGTDLVTSVSAMDPTAMTPNSALVYTSLYDCINNASTPISTFKISAGAHSLQIFYKVPADVSYTDKSLTFTAVASGVTSSTAASFMIRASTSPSYHLLAIERGFKRIYKDVCYPINLPLYSYANNYNNPFYSYPTSGGLNFNLSSSNSKLKFYNSGNCLNGTETNNFSIPQFNSNAPGSVRYISDGSESTDFRIPVSLSTNDPSIDSAAFGLGIDVTGSATISQLQFTGPNATKIDVCEAYTITTTNNNNTPLATAGTLMLTVSSTSPGVNLYLSSTSCAGTVGSAMITPYISSGATSTTIYFKATAAGTATINSNVTTGGSTITAPAQTVIVH